VVVKRAVDLRSKWGKKQEGMKSNFEFRILSFELEKGVKVNGYISEVEILGRVSEVGGWENAA
jgi:hypothetical protein